MRERNRGVHDERPGNGNWRRKANAVPSKAEIDARGKENVVPIETKINSMGKDGLVPVEAKWKNGFLAFRRRDTCSTLPSVSNVAGIGSVDHSLESAEEQLPPLVSQLPSPLDGLYPDCQENLVTCVVEPAGNLALRLRAGVVLDIYPSNALRLHNTRQDTTFSLSLCY